MKSTEICLVLEHLENVRGEIFQNYPDIISDDVSGKPGVYALYSKGALYYVGLASDMRNRLETHLKDIHANRWDKFSVYLSHDGQYLRELESLLIRIAQPRGNAVRGHFPRSENILPRLKKDMAQHDKETRDGIFGIEPEPPVGNRKPKRDFSGTTTKLRSFYKGSVYNATLLRDASVRFNGEVFSSMSTAAESVTGIPTSGPAFWRFKDKNGDWVRMTFFK
jgi:hypothetical protein